MRNTITTIAILLSIFIGLSGARTGNSHDVTVRAGGKANFSCEKKYTKIAACRFSVIGSGETSDVTLLSSYSPVKINADFKKTGVLMTLEENLYQGRCTLNLHNVQPEITGRITCTLLESGKNIHNQFYILIVQVMPSIKDIKYNYNYIKNDDKIQLNEEGTTLISLYTKAENGMPAAGTQWQIIGQFEQPTVDTGFLDVGILRTSYLNVYFEIGRNESKPERTIIFTYTHDLFPDGKISRVISIGYSYATTNAEIKIEYFQLPENGSDGWVAQLTCVADGIPKPAIEWQWSQYENGFYEKYTDKLSELETGDQINTTRTGYFKCLAQNAKNVDWVRSLSTELEWRYLATTEPKVQVVKESYPNGSDGDIALLICRTSNFYPVEYAWEYAVENGSVFYAFRDVVSATEYNSEITTNNKGFYRCLAKRRFKNNYDWIRSSSVEVNDVGKSVPSIKPFIFYKKNIRMYGSQRYRIDDDHTHEDVELQCMMPYIYRLVPRIFWDSKPPRTDFVYTDTKIKETHEGIMYVSTLTTKISPFEKKPERTFVCSAKYNFPDGNPVVFTETVTLGFKYKTTEVRSFEGPKAYHGGNRKKVLYCKADGIPEPKIEWRIYRNGNYKHYESGAHITRFERPYSYKCYARNSMNEPSEWVETSDESILIPYYW